METLEDAIRRLIKKNYGSIPKFAAVIDVPENSIYSALSRGMGNTRTELTDKIYRELNIDWDTAKLGDDYRGLKLKTAVPNTNMVDVPLYGAIAAGTPIEMTPVENTQPIPAKVHELHPDAFLLKVEGNSMNRVLPNGSYALIDPCKTVERDGAPYAVCVNGYDATIKRVRRLNNGFQLVPDSTDPTYEAKTYNYNEPETQTITVIGRVVYYVLPFDWEF
jgi:transcriptional regulator, XRE family